MVTHCNSSPSPNALLFVRPYHVCHRQSELHAIRRMCVPNIDLCVLILDVLFVSFTASQWGELLYSDKDSDHGAFSEMHSECNESNPNWFAGWQLLYSNILNILSDSTQIFVKIASVFFFFLFLNCGESEQSKVVFDFISCTQRSHLTLSRSLSLKWYSIKSLNYCNQTLLHIDWICTFLWFKRANKLCARCTKKQTHYKRLCVIFSRLSQLIAAIQQIYVAVSYYFCCVVSTDALSLFWVLLQFVCVCTSVFARTCMTCCCWRILCVCLCAQFGALWNNSYL